MKHKIYEIRSEFYRTDRRAPLALYQPKEDSPNKQIAVIAMHGMDYMSFPPVIELAKRGFIAIGSNPAFFSRDIRSKMLDVKSVVDFVKAYPGVKKVILMGHSGGGSMLSCYQYIAECGAARFQTTDRIIPFPEIEPLTPADGMILIDNNYGIMPVLAMDPAVKTLDNGFQRIPELDIYSPENGYDPEGSHYTEEFKRAFQKAQINFYRSVLAYAQERYEIIKAGKGRFCDDEPLVIPGAAGNSDFNKLFLQDTSLLNHTRGEHTILHKNGETSKEIAYTVRPPKRAPNPESLRGALNTTVLSFLSEEFRFEDDFGYDECSMWGGDWDFIKDSTRANVKGIKVPTLVEGNTGSHEFIQAEYIYENSASADKDLFFLEGADHNFMSLDEEKYGDTLAALADYLTAWLTQEGRFI